MPEHPSKPITARGPKGGQYSTIRYPDGLVETILFDRDGNAVATKRTFVGLSEIQREHIRQIENGLMLDAARSDE